MAIVYTTNTLNLGTACNSLANSITSVAQSDAITTSTTTNVADTLVQIALAVGASSPNQNTNIYIYAFGSIDGTYLPGAAASTEVISNTASVVTLSANSTNIKLLGAIYCHTASTTFTSEPMSIAAAFGGIVPKKWGIIVQNQTGVALSATGHSAKYTEVSYS